MIAVNRAYPWAKTKEQGNIRERQGPCIGVTSNIRAWLEYSVTKITLHLSHDYDFDSHICSDSESESAVVGILTDSGIQIR